MLPLLTDLTVTHLSRCQAVTRDGENTLAECTNAGGGDLKWFCLVCQIQLVDGKRSSNQIKIIFDVSKKCLLRIRGDRGGKSVRKQWLINIFRVINRLQQGFPNDVSVAGYLICLIWFVQYIFTSWGALVAEGLNHRPRHPPFAPALSTLHSCRPSTSKTPPTTSALQPFWDIWSDKPK